MRETDVHSQSSERSHRKISSKRKSVFVSSPHLRNRLYQNSAPQSRDGSYKRYKKAWWKSLAGRHRIIRKGDGDFEVFKSRKRFRRGTGTTAAPYNSGSSSSPTYFSSTSGYGSDGTWSHFQDYREELNKYVKDEWNQRVTKFQSEFQKNPM